MSIILTGNAANVTTPLTATVSSLSNNGGGLIRVATSAAHLFGPNDRVLMAASPATGFFNINVIDSTHFDLQGSTFTTTGTGTAIDVSLTPQIQVPTDGDTFSLQLSGMLSALQALCDRTQFLQTKNAAYRLVSITEFGANIGTAATTWGSLTTTDTSFHTIPAVGGGVTLPWTVAGIEANDFIEILFTSTAFLTMGATGWYELSMGFAVTSGSPTFAKVPKSGIILPFNTGIAINLATPVAVNAAFQAANAGTLNLNPAATCAISNSSTIILEGDVNALVKVWRPAG